MSKYKYLCYNKNISSKARCALFIIFWVFAALCLTVIFLFSAQSGDASQLLSDNVGGFLTRLLGDGLTSFIVRKFAHFFEFAALAFFLCGAMFMTRKKYSPVVTFILSVLCSIGDEIHQYFVPGRACRLFDVFVDSLGSTLGILIFTAILALSGYIRLRRNKAVKV